MESSYNKLNELMNDSSDQEKKAFLQQEGLPENFFELNEEMEQALTEPLNMEPSEGVKSRLDHYFEVKHAGNTKQQSVIPVPNFLQQFKLQSLKWFLTGATACLLLFALVRIDFGPQGEWESGHQFLADTAVENVVDSNQIIVGDSLGL